MSETEKCNYSLKIEEIINKERLRGRRGMARGRKACIK